LFPRENKVKGTNLSEKELKVVEKSRNPWVNKLKKISTLDPEVVELDKECRTKII